MPFVSTATSHPAELNAVSARAKEAVKALRDALEDKSQEQKGERRGVSP